MNREEKAALVEEYSDKFERAKIAIVADYRGLTVPVFQQLRQELKKNNSEIKVAKNTLLKRAIKDTAFEPLAEFFSGTTAVAVSFDDPVSPAKIICAFAKENEKFSIRSAVLDGKILSVYDIEALAKLPSRDVLLAKLMSVMQAVPTNFVQVLNGVPRKFVCLLQAVKDQKEQGH